MRTQHAPTLERLKPIVAALPEPFTLKDIMTAACMPENPARAALKSMRQRDWVDLVSRKNSNGQSHWTRTRWYGLDRVSAGADMQRAGLERIGQCLAGWRVNHA